MRHFYPFLILIMILFLSCNNNESGNNNSPNNPTVVYENIPIKSNTYNDSIELKFGSLEIYNTRNLDLIDATVSHINGDNYVLYKAIFDHSDLNALNNNKLASAELCEFVTYNGTKYISCMTIMEFTADMSSIHRDLFTFKNNNVIGIRFYSNFNKDDSRYITELSNYTNMLEKPPVLTKNLDILSRNIINQDSCSAELNNWYKETDEAMKLIRYK